jgi:nitrile hydratase
MNGAHDLGGMHGLGPVNPYPEEPLFHEEWERRIFAMYVATLFVGIYAIDELRKNIEVMHPTHYLDSTYYEHWAYCVEKSLIDRGVISEAQVLERMNQLAGEAA